MLFSPPIFCFCCQIQKYLNSITIHSLVYKWFCFLHRYISTHKTFTRQWRPSVYKVWFRGCNHRFRTKELKTATENRFQYWKDELVNKIIPAFYFMDIQLMLYALNKYLWAESNFSLTAALCCYHSCFPPHVTGAAYACHLKVQCTFKWHWWGHVGTMIVCWTNKHTNGPTESQMNTLWLRGTLAHHKFHLTQRGSNTWSSVRHHYILQDFKNRKSVHLLHDKVILWVADTRLTHL